MREQLVLFLCLAMLTVSTFDNSWGRATQPAKVRIAKCLTDDELANAVFSLSQQYPEAQAAQGLLGQTAQRSLACRQKIIAAVMNAMDKPNLDLRYNQASARLWREGAILLGGLKATQALDLLLSHITITDGEWSQTMTHQPALAGIIDMGPIAIPKLRKLLQHQDPETRHFTVYCLAKIGGVSARRAIQTAVPTEIDPCVKGFMIASVRLMDVKHGGMKPDHGEWGRAFMCTP